MGNMYLKKTSKTDSNGYSWLKTRNSDVQTTLRKGQETTEKISIIFIKYAWGLVVRVFKSSSVRENF